MKDPAQLFRLETDTDLADLSASTLVVALRGFLDAGHVQRIAVDHLKRTLDHTVVATFDIDELLDYRARRPRMRFERDRYSGYTDPALVLYRFVDESGHPFFLLDGPEPDYQWERVVAAIMMLCRGLGVETVLTMYGIPMGVPHTRPVGATIHATTEELRKAVSLPLLADLEVPGSVAGLLEYRLGEEGRAAAGFAIYVPHYLAQNDYPAGADRGLELISRASGLDVARTGLELAAAEAAQVIDAEVRRSPEAGQIVKALEEQYDAYTAGAGRMIPLQAADADEGEGEAFDFDASSIPSGDQLGAEVEAFLDEIQKGQN